MKKIILLLTIIFTINIYAVPANAFWNGNYTNGVAAKYNKADIKQIKALFKVHNEYSNRHDIKGLDSLYSDKYVNNDGFDKKIYFESIKDTWETCKDITYKTKITGIRIDGDFASVDVQESAVGTLFDTIGTYPVAGEIHSDSTGIYHLTKVNGRWLITGETALSDDSSLLYGDARYAKMELSAPNQVNAGEHYTASVKIDADESVFVIGSISNDPLTYPPGPPSGTMRALPASHTLERILYSNRDNLNEYAVSTLVISRLKDSGLSGVSLTGLACLMKRVNVVPKNNFINQEIKKDENIDR